jgi:hypothetical protein
LSKALPSSLSLLFFALALPLSGCAGYVSDYVPPDRGRARLLFRDTEAIASLPPVDRTCLREVEGDSEGPSYRIVRGGGGARIVYWVPVHHGPAPHLHPGERAASGGRRQFASPGMRGSGGRVHSGGSHSSSNSGSSSGGGGGGDVGKAVVVLAVLAIVVLPVVTFSLALGTPESEPNMSRSIDRVNLFNDLARSPGSPCAEPEPELPPPPPPPDALPPPEEP